MGLVLNREILLPGNVRRTAPNHRGRLHSYSKTDHDATVMRMKEDHMRNGQRPIMSSWQQTEKNPQKGLLQNFHLATASLVMETTGITPLTS